MLPMAQARRLQMIPPSLSTLLCSSVMMLLVTVEWILAHSQAQHWDSHGYGSTPTQRPDYRARTYNIIQADQLARLKNVDGKTSSGGMHMTGNPIDDCWRADPNWAYNRHALALCSMGFGARALGGASGPLYVVSDDSDTDLINTAPGTLRYGVLLDGPLWIGFSRDMTITLQNELIMTSFKTIDGRGFDVHIAGGGGLTLQYISNVIIHGVHIHDLRFTPPAFIRSNATHVGHRGGSDGDAVSIFGSQDVWVDHCYLARGSDGLLDAIMGSTAITVSNNYFEQHDKVTVAFNHFGSGLIERIPRVRHGNVHVVNNVYDGWGIYAIGGSESPTIVSEGNIFNAPNTRDKQVSKRINDDGAFYGDNQSWNWLPICVLTACAALLGGAHIANSDSL